MQLALAVLVISAVALTAFGQGHPEAERKIKLCCGHLNEADADCKAKYCSFDAISQTNILGYLGTCVSKGPTVGQMWDCASSRIDHSECCKGKGVTGACLEYCAAHDGVPTNYLNYLFCLNAFDRVRECFETHLDSHPNLKGDN